MAQSDRKPQPARVPHFFTELNCCTSEITVIASVLGHFARALRRAPPPRGTGAGPRYVPRVPEVKLSRMSRKSIPIYHVVVVIDANAGLVEQNNALGAKLVQQGFV